jgi:uncharacterized alkaline shock family protein YloU
MEERRGEIQIADQVVAVIAGVVAEEVPGISVRAGSLYHDLAMKISGGAKGISVSISDSSITIEMRISVKYGLRIHQVCRQLQEKVKDMVEALTGLLVEAVHVRVEGIELK